MDREGFMEPSSMPQKRLVQLQALPNVSDSQGLRTTSKKEPVWGEGRSGTDGDTGFVARA